MDDRDDARRLGDVRRDCRHRRGSDRHVRGSRCASGSDCPHRRLSCRDRGRPRRDRTRSFHRHTLGPAWILTPRTASEVFASMLERIPLLSALRPVTTMIVLHWRFHLRGSSPGSKYSRPSGPMAVTWVTYSPDFAQWKWDGLPGRTMTLPGGYGSTLSPWN